MNTKRFDDKPRQDVKQKDSARCGNRYLYPKKSRRLHPSRCNRFRHLPLHPNRLTQPGWVILKLANKLLHGWDLKVYLFLLDKAERDTGRCWYWQKTISEELKCSVPSVKRAVDELDRLQLIAVERTRTGNLMTLLNPPAPEGSPMIPAKKEAHEITIAYAQVISGRVANAPLPRAREGAFEPKPGSPDEPLWASNPAIAAKEPRFPPRNPQNQPRRRWTGRSHSVVRQLAPVQKAAEGVMAALGVAEGLWKTREAIAHAIRQWLQPDPTRELEEAIAALVACWRDYQRMPMRFRWGLISFFGENHWQKRSSWPVDRRAQQEQRLAAEARVGNGGTFTEEEAEVISEYFRARERERQKC